MPDHAENVRKSRRAADKEKYYYGGGDMSGDDKWVGSNKGTSPADTYTKEAAKLPVKDAEDTARRKAREAGAYRKTSKKRSSKK
jgi:hypothetical protein